MPTVQFVNEFGSLPLTEMCALLTRYAAEVYPNKVGEVVKQLTDAAYRALPEDDDEEKPSLMTVADFLASVGEPPPSIVPDFLPACKLICMSGPAKEGKSLVCYEFLQCIALGEALMGKFPVTSPGAVAYFGLEDGAHEIKSRLLQRGITTNPNFYVCAVSFDMNTPKGWGTFQSLVDGLPEKPQLVIIDTMREAFRSIQNFNDAALVGPALSPLRRWAHKHCTVILVVHNNKDKFATGNNVISGSTALVSSCDSTMILTNKKVLDNGNLRWDWTQGGRSVKEIKHVLEMDTDTLRVSCLSKNEETEWEAQKKRDARESLKLRIAAALFAAGELTTRQLADAVDSVYDTVGESLKSMRADGHAVDTGRKVESGGGRPSPTYQLTITGRDKYALQNEAF